MYQKVNFQRRKLIHSLLNSLSFDCKNYRQSSSNDICSEVQCFLKTVYADSIG